MTSPDAEPGPAAPSAPAAPAPGRPAPVVPAPADRGASAGEPALPAQSREDTDAAWGDYPERDDDRLYRDRPPHWDDF
jgi:hypothetical protein